MNDSTIEKVDIMIAAAEKWLRDHDYRYMECNYVPPGMFTRSRKINLLLRTVYRLLPFNLRSRRSIDRAPFTPHATAAMLKAFGAAGDTNTTAMLTRRALKELRSPATKEFSLRQGIRVAVNLYEDSADDPSPLNTVFFGEFLLDDKAAAAIDDEVRRETVLSICRYITEELGYEDYGRKGIYFRYGHNISNIIYNASAVISSFLIRAGNRYDMPGYIELGKRGIDYIVNCQNSDGSWFYYGPPLKKAIDGFHQCYVLRALLDARKFYDGIPDECLRRGADFYRSQHHRSGRYLIPVRYDRRFNPRNTWLLQRVDGRDITEALVFYSLYEPDAERVEGLVEYMYDHIFRPASGRFAPEIFVYGRNRNDYIEFYAWYLHALWCVKRTFS